MIELKRSQFIYGNEIIHALNEEGINTFYVGGCVRDYILDRPIHDIDLATDATPEQIKKIFPRTISLGIEHGTVIIRHRQQSFEITTFRSDASSRKPGTLIEQLKEDLRLRDFTINAMAMTSEGKLIDPFQGRKHLEDQLLQGVDDPYERIKEDPLRILRAYRFASELGFTVETDTKQAMKMLNSTLEEVAIERIYQEFTKLIQGTYLNKVFVQLIKDGVFNHLPGLAERKKALEDLCQNIIPLSSFSELIVLMHVYDRDISINQLIRDWKAPRKIQREAQNLIAAIDEYEEKGLTSELLYELGEEQIKSFSRLSGLIFKEATPEAETLLNMYQNLPIHSKKDMAITGHDLKKLYPETPAGPWMKDYLQRIEGKIIKGELSNEYEEIKEWVLCHPPGNNL